MNHIRLLTFAALIVATATSDASTLTVSVRSHSTMISEGAESHPAYAVFADEHVIVDVQLDIYKLDVLPETAAYHAELRQLSESDWFASVQWRLTERMKGPVDLNVPLITSNRSRNRGPNAPLVGDRDSTVECRTHLATFDFGSLPPGDYTLTGAVHGLSSQYQFGVRTGEESTWRDTYLDSKTARAKTYEEYRRLTLERLQSDVHRVDILLDLIDQSLQYGTLDETRSYVARAVQIVEHKQTNSGADRREAIAYLRQFDSILPEYFARRKEWRITRDAKTGRHVIRSRVTGDVVREIGPAHK